MRSFFTILLKTLLYTILVLLLLIGAVVVGLQMPAVQTQAVRYATKRISATLQFPVDIKRVAIKWFDTVTMEGVSIQNRNHDPMIDVGRLEVNFNLRNLIDSSAHNIHLDEVLLYRPDVLLAKNPKTGDLNLDEFLGRINELLADTTKPEVHDQNVPFTIGKATLVDGKFTYSDPREAKMTGRVFDYNHFTVNEINVNLKNFLLLGDTIAVDIGRLRGVDRQADLRIRRLDTRFLYCRKQMRLDHLNAHINGSVIGNNLTFTYNEFSDFNEFNDRVLMRVSLRQSVVRAQDLVPFASYFEKNFDVARASGDFVGTVRNFRFHHADIRFGQNSRLVGEVAFKGLPDVDNTVVDFRFKPSVVNMADVKTYYSDKDFDPIANKLGLVGFAATFAGKFTDFKTVGTFNTGLGMVTGDLALKLNGPKKTTYRGNLRASNFNIGRLIDQSELVQRIDGQARFEGKGLTINGASLDIDAQINQIGVKNYTYHQVALRGNLQNSFFNGQAMARDTNLNLSLDGEFDLRGAKNVFDVRGTVQRIDLRALQLMDDSLVVRSDLDVQLVGNNVNELTGNARLRNTYLTLGKRNLVLDTLFVASSLEGDQRTITLNSDLLAANLKGNFELTQTADDLNRLAKEYRLNFAGDAAGLAAYYQQKQKRLAPVVPYSIDYQLMLKNVQPLLGLIYPAMYISPNTRLDGRFSVDHSSLLLLNGTVDTLKIDDYTFYTSTIDLNTSKFVNAPDVLASLIVNSTRQHLGPLTPSENLQAEASWDVNHIDFTGSLKQQNSTNHANLNGSLTFKGDAIDIELDRSRFLLMDSIWTISPNNLIRIVGPDVTVRNLTVSNHQQVISASGRISPDSSQSLQIATQNFALQSLNPLLNTSLAGTANGSVSLRGLYGLTLLDGTLNVDSLKYNDILIGNVVNRSALDRSNRLNIDTRIRRLDQEVLTVTGIYDPRQSATNPLDLQAVLNGTDLRLVEPFTEGLVTNVSGTATGTVTITGPVNNPVLGGSVDVKSGKLTIDYLKAEVGFEDKVYFGSNEIIARRMTLTDPDGNKAVLRGGVYHDGFRYFTVDMTADMNNFRILNTTLKDNDLFYGTAVVTGRASLSGPFDNLAIKANVTSNRGTRIFIPLDQAASVTEEEVIRFINTSPNKKTTTTQTSEPQVDLSGIKMDFNLSVTPDAYCEIQLNRQTGDILKAYGSGQIAMEIDTKGDFTMTGAYEIDQGEYTFTFENIINKRFQILPNSRITWTGDPYEAMVDVKTAYTQYASLDPIIRLYATNSTVTDQSRRYPVDLLINLKGRLLSPDITYDLKVKEYPQQPDFRQAVTAFEARLKSNDQELGRQVSSILLFSQIAPSEGLMDPSGNGNNNFVGAGLTNSISELLSNQLSRLASTLDKNLNVGVSLNGLGLDQNLVNNLQVRFSYRFNNRFRISRDGGFTYGQSQTSVASLLGEWTLEYWLTPNGQLRLKMYNRNQNQLGQLGTAVTYGTLTTGGGMSIQYTRSFNRFNQLFHRRPERPQPGVQPLPEAPKNRPPGPVTMGNSALEDEDR